MATLAHAHPVLDKFLAPGASLMWLHQINMEEAGLLASKEPSLLSVSSEAVRATFEVLRVALGDVTRLEASRVAVFTPSLLCTPADVLQSRFQVCA